MIHAVKLDAPPVLFQQADISQVLSRAAFAAPILRDLTVELRTIAGPQRLLSFSDLGVPEAAADWTEIERTFFRQNRDAIIEAISAINPSIRANPELLRQQAFPMVPPESEVEAINVDTFGDQIDKLLSIYNQVVLGKKKPLHENPLLIVGGIVAGLGVLTLMVFLARRGS